MRSGRGHPQGSGVFAVSRLFSLFLLLRSWDLDMTDKQRRVILLIESSRAYGRGCLLGIGAFVRNQGFWRTLHVELRIDDDLPDVVRNWHCDGVMTRLENEKTLQAVLKLGVPIVDLRSASPPPGGASIFTDPESCARLAVEHFLDRGFRNFGFIGFPGLDYSDRRCECFVRQLSELGHETLVFGRPFPSPKPGGMAVEETRGEILKCPIAKWVLKLPKPVAVFACNDVRGRQVLDACHHAGVIAPEEVAVLGVDNDEVVCGLSMPPLSSIRPNTFQMGYEGAALLDALMRGEAPPEAPILIPPCDVVVRRSSDVLALEDPELTAALRLIRDRACEGIDVGDILKNVAVSRATLERRFQQTLGRSPKEEIVRGRIDRAKHLLTETPYKLQRIAVMTGYQTAAQFTLAFKRRTGLTPGQYRRAYRTDPFIE